MTPGPYRFTLLKSRRAEPSLYGKEDLRALGLFVVTAEKVRGPVELTLELTGHDRIRRLNRRFRGVDRTTDVISFRNSPPPRLEGDIAVNVEQAVLQARRIRHPAKREVRLLWIHGILHLLGYTDYEPAPRRKMFRRQNSLLRRWERRS